MARKRSRRSRETTVPADSWASSLNARRTMVATRGRDTGPQLTVRSGAFGLGLVNRDRIGPHHDQRRTADLVFTGPRRAVFVDGCFWHGCPWHFVPQMANGAFWAAKI